MELLFTPLSPRFSVFADTSMTGRRSRSASRMRRARRCRPTRDSTARRRTPAPSIARRSLRAMSGTVVQSVQCSAVGVSRHDQRWSPPLQYTCSDGPPVSIQYSDAPTLISIPFFRRKSKRKLWCCVSHNIRVLCCCGISRCCMPLRRRTGARQRNVLHTFFLFSPLPRREWNLGTVTYMMLRVRTDMRVPVRIRKRVMRECVHSQQCVAWTIRLSCVRILSNKSQLLRSHAADSMYTYF